MGQVEQALQGDPNVRKNVVFEAVSDFILAKCIKEQEVRTVCKMLVKGYPENISSLLASQNRIIQISKAHPIW